MKRIDTPSAVPDENGPGKSGFRDGDLAAGVTPTSFNADWANNVQEEIANAIEGAGVVLNGGNQAQLLGAIQALITGRFTGSNQIVAFPGYQRLPGGLRLVFGQIGVPDLSGATIINVTFPLALENTPVVLISDDSNQDAYLRVINRSITGFSIVATEANTDVRPHTLQWFAISWGD